MYPKIHKIHHEWTATVALGRKIIYICSWLCFLFFQCHDIFSEYHSKFFIEFHTAASYMHPLEFVLTDSIPSRIGPLIFGSHPVTIWIWHIIINLYTINSHSGYHLPFLPSNENHDYHHYRFNVNYGSLGFFDALHGTDKSFKNSKASTRHVTLTSLLSARELYPDDEK